MATLTTSDGVRIRYEDTMGTGTPVVLVHGWPLDHCSWGPQMQALSDAGHRVISYDRRGFGESGHNCTDYSYDRLATDLHELLVHLDIVDVMLVGFSMGSGEVVRYMKMHTRQAIRSTCIIAGVTPYLLKTEAHPEGGFPEENVGGFLDSAKANKEEFFSGFFRSAFYAANGQLAVSETVVEESMAAMRSASLDAIVETARGWATTDFRRGVSAVRVPTLVIHGDSDVAVPLEVSGQRTHEMIEDSTLHVVAGGPHGLLASHADEVSEQLVKWAHAH